MEFLECDWKTFDNMSFSKPGYTVAFYACERAGHFKKASMILGHLDPWPF